MSPVPSGPWQWGGCVAWPATAHSTTVHLPYTHPPTCLPICPGQLGNREQVVIGDSRCQEVPLAAQVPLWWVDVTAERKAYDESGAGGTCRQDCVHCPCRSASLTWKPLELPCGAAQVQNVRTRDCGGPLPIPCFL